jgi:hypothetical protein
VKKHKFLSIQRETVKLLSSASLATAAGGIILPKFPKLPDAPEDGPRSNLQYDCHDSNNVRCGSIFRE